MSPGVVTAGRPTEGEKTESPGRSMMTETVKPVPRRDDGRSVTVNGNIDGMVSEPETVNLVVERGITTTGTA